MAHPLLKKLAKELDNKEDDKKKPNPFVKKEKKLGEQDQPEDQAPEKDKDSTATPEAPKEQEGSTDGNAAQAPAATPQGKAVDPVAVMDFLHSTENIDDAAFHAFAEQNGFDVHQTEAVAYNLAQRLVCLLREGKSQGMDPNSVDPEQLAMGMKIEAEHTSCPILQKKISLDHLAENPQYYSQDCFQKELQSEHGQEKTSDLKTHQKAMSVMRGKRIIPAVPTTMQAEAANMAEGQLKRIAPAATKAGKIWGRMRTAGAVGAGIAGGTAAAYGLSKLYNRMNQPAVPSAGGFNAMYKQSALQNVYTEAFVGMLTKKRGT